MGLGTVVVGAEAAKGQDRLNIVANIYNRRQGVSDVAPSESLAPVSFRKEGKHQKMSTGVPGRFLSIFELFFSGTCEDCVHPCCPTATIPCPRVLPVLKCTT